MPFKATVDLVLGAQWGDEGKGKIVDVLATKAHVVCRCQGGSNAGHTVLVGDKEYKFHLIPSGITNESVKVIIGNGVVLHIPTLLKEIADNEAKGLSELKKRMKISNRTHIVFDMHQQVDGLLEQLRNKNSIGTTKRGIGPTYSTKALRNGLRLADLMGDYNLFTEKFQALVDYHQRLENVKMNKTLLNHRFPQLEVNVDEELVRYKEFAEILRPMVEDTIVTLNKELQKETNILIEGANATMLDIDFGTYPYVTSSNCGSGGVCTGLGLPPQAIKNIYGVVKAYTTRVGGGVLPTELLDENGEKLQTIGAEFGTTTGRSRRCGWLDLVVVKYTHMVNGFTGLAVTKIDVLDDFDEIKVAVNYKMNGEIVPSFPASLADLEKIEVIYETLPGWKTDLSGIRKYEDLPENAKLYLKRIEEHCGVPVKWVSVGKSRDAIITIY